MALLPFSADDRRCTYKIHRPSGPNSPNLNKTFRNPALHRFFGVTVIPPLLPGSKPLTFCEDYAMFAARSNRYVPLLDQSGNCESSSDFGSPTPSLDEKRRKDNTITIPWTLIVVILCTLLNITLSVFPTVFTQRKEVPQADTLITRQNIHHLRRPNQYIGFDEIQRPIPPVSRQLTTYPILLSLVDAASPDTVFDDDFAMQMVHSGTITPDDRRVRVTPTVSPFQP